MFSDYLQFALIGLTAFLAILTIEIKNMLYAATAFSGMCTTIGALFWLLDAPYVAVFQLLVYAGAVVIIFLAVIMLTARKEEIR